MHAGIFVATRWEVGAIRQALAVERPGPAAGGAVVTGHRGACRVSVFQTGVGEARTAAVCRDVLGSQRLEAAVASGFACALGPYAIGTILIGTDVIRQDQRTGPPAEALPCAEELRGLALEAAAAAGVEARAGRIVTVPHVLWEAADKRRVAAASGAIGADMESAAVGAAARERHIPFVVIRGVSDLMDEDLPFDFNEYLQGGWRRAAAACLARPSRLAGLNRLRRQAAVASERMTRFYGAFLDALDPAAEGSRRAS
jgi:adenosylhomocysteine nucleosidase